MKPVQDSHFPQLLSYFSLTTSSRVDTINSHLLLNNEEHQRMVSLEQQLHRVEEKLDALMELMATHAVNGF